MSGSNVSCCVTLLAWLPETFAWLPETLLEWYVRGFLMLLPGDTPNHLLKTRLVQGHTVQLNKIEKVPAVGQEYCKLQTIILQ